MLAGAEEESAGIAVVLEELLIAWVRTMTGPQQLSLGAAGTLATLDRLGPRSVGELASSEHVSQPAMTQLVDRLERDRLVERRHVVRDQRIVSVSITRAGRSLLARRRRLRAQRLGDLLDRLPAAERASLTAALPALGRLAQLAHAGTEQQAAVG